MLRTPFVWATFGLCLVAVSLGLRLPASPVFAQTNSPPEITSMGPFTVAEGTTEVGTLTATDEDTADDLTWSIPQDAAGGADASRFTLSTAGVLAFDSAKDYEAPDDAGADGVYEVTVQVSDGTDTNTADLVVELENVTEIAEDITGPTEVAFAENGWGRVATFAASSEADRDGVDWFLSGVDGGRFSIDKPDGALRFDLDTVGSNVYARPPDFEVPVDSDTDNVYALTLLARVGTEFRTLAVTVTVTDVTHT